jgi:hypothetical protein
MPDLLPETYATRIRIDEPGFLGYIIAMGIDRHPKYCAQCDALMDFLTEVFIIKRHP